MRIEIRPFESSRIDAAARLLAARHRAQRAVCPGLDPAYEDLATARIAIEGLAASDGASGAVAVRDGSLIGYLIAIEHDPLIWGPNAWVESGGHAVAEPEVARELYRVAAAAWVDAGRSHHYVVLPATDAGLIDAWARLEFGQQHVHALRESPPTSYRPSPPDGLIVRRAVSGDIAQLAQLERVLPEHQARAPVFSRLPVPALAIVHAELEAAIEDPRFAIFVAARGGRVVGSATACSIELSSTNSGLIRPASAGFLGHAAVLPEARGIGAGRALGEAVLVWSRDAGYPWVASDWRVTNLEASRAWPRLGFRPTFVRLHRAIT